MDPIKGLKPLRLKVSIPGTEYVMVLVKRESLVHHLREEINETLRKLFPCSSSGQIESIRKDNGRVLLPEWYPVEPLLKDDEEIVITYKPFNSDYAQSTDNVYTSRSVQRNGAVNWDSNMTHLECNSAPHLNHAGIKNDSFLPVSVGAMDNDSSQGIFKDLNDVSRGNFNVPDVEQFVNGVLQYSEATKSRKRKEEVSHNVSHRLESEAPIGVSAGIQSEFSFKKLKTGIVDGTIFQADTNLPTTEVGHNEVASNLTNGESEEPPMKHAEKSNSETLCSKHDVTKIEMFSDTLIKDPNSNEQIDEVERNSSRKKKKHRKEKRGEILHDSYLMAKNCIAVSNEDTSKKVHRKGKHKKYSQLESEVEDCKQDENSVASTLILCKSLRGIANNDLEEKVDDFELDGEDSNRATEEAGEVREKKRSKEKKQKKKARKRTKDEEGWRHDAAFENAVSNSSDVKESGIGSDSTLCDIGKRVSALPNKKEIVRASFFEKEENSQALRIGKEANVVREALSVESDLSMMLESTSKERSFDSEDKQNTAGFVVEKRSVNGSQEEVMDFKQPHTDIKKMSKENQDLKAVSKDKAENVGENLQDKPSFDYETDTEICQIRSQIHKIVDDVVEESDCQQRLLKEPLKFSLMGNSTWKERGKSPTDARQNMSPKNNSTIENCTIENEGKEGHKKKSIKLDRSKWGESGYSAKENTEIRKELRSDASKGRNMEIAMSSDELSLDLYSDTSSMTFSDIVPCKIPTQKTHKPSKREDKPGQQKKKQLKVKEEDAKVDGAEETISREKGDENSKAFGLSAKGTTVKLTEHFERRKSSDSAANSKSKSAKGKRKLDKKSRSGTRKSFAKVEDWLSKMEADKEVPTDTELGLEMEKNKDSVVESSELNNGKDESLCVTKAKELCENTDAGGDEELNEIAAVGNDEIKCDSKPNGFNDSGTSNALDIIEKSSCRPVEYDSSCTGPSPKKKKRVSERPKSKRSSETNSRKDKQIGDLKFNALIEDGGSMVSCKVSRRLLPNTNASKPLTGFLSHEDQKRFQSKLQRNTKSSAK